MHQSWTKLRIWIMPRRESKHGSPDGSMFASWSKGCGFESCWILWEHASKLNLLDYLVDFWGWASELIGTMWTGYYYKEIPYKQAYSIASFQSLGNVPVSIVLCIIEHQLQLYQEARNDVVLRCQDAHNVHRLTSPKGIIYYDDWVHFIKLV